MKLAALLLLVALPAGAQELGLTVEGQAALVIAQDGRGSSSTGGGGARLGVDLLRGGALGLRAELSWLRFGGSQGTDAVVVSRTFDELLLGLRAGWRMGRPGLGIEPYALAGPVLTVASSDYRIVDPLGAPTSPGASGTELGAGYGLGLALLAGDGSLRFASRIEAARLHRAGAADVALQVGIGLAL